MRLVLVVLAVVLFASDAQAQLFRRRARSCEGGSCAVQKAPTQKAAVQKITPTQKATPVQKSVTTGDPKVAAVALGKARILARRGYGGHVGGSMAGCHAEGWGGGMSPAAARADACFWGRRKVVGSACVFNGRQWFAVVLYE